MKYTGTHGHTHNTGVLVILKKEIVLFVFDSFLSGGSATQL